jgi:Zn-dependent protease with chaperone function
MDMVMATREFLNKATPEQARFVIAHEMSHAKTEDAYGAKNIAKGIKKGVFQTLLAGIGFSIVTGALGIVTPAIMSSGSFTTLAAWAGATVDANLGINYVTRIIERRADRNAVYLTGNAEAGVKFLASNSPKGKAPSRRPFWLPEVSSHPSYHPRVANLRASFALTSSYPQPSTAGRQPIPVAPPKPAETRKPGGGGMWVEP